MLIVNVYIKVKPDQVDAFIEATKENVKNSRKEPGVLRFDFLQQEDDPLHFLLIEAYKNEDAVSAHKETPHYEKWRSIAESMMEGPRKRTRYVNIDPEDAGF